MDKRQKTASKSRRLVLHTIIMSTTFGIIIPTTGEVIEVAFRTHYVRWENPLAHLLPDETTVEPLDNSAQGIYTIGDIKKAIAENAP